MPASLSMGGEVRAKKSGEESNWSREGQRRGSERGCRDSHLERIRIELKMQWHLSGGWMCMLLWV